MLNSEDAATSGLDGILSDLSGYLACELDEGAREAPVAPAVLSELSRPAEAFQRRPDAASMLPSPPASVPASGTERTAQLAAIAREVAACVQCPLHRSRTQTVPGQGNSSPEIVFVGEGPGADEDREGLAFVGRSGQLLARMIEAMGLTREDVFICNIVKCRPPENRAPEPGEMTACIPFLRRQLDILAPKVIVTLGSTALTGLVEMPKGLGISKARGEWLRFEGVDLMPTFHPAYMLRNPNMKKYVWEDLKAVLRHLNRPIPPVKTS